MISYLILRPSWGLAILKNLIKYEQKRFLPGRKICRSEKQGLVMLRRSQK